MKFLLRGESPRDHVDITLAFKHQPTLLICDIPNFVARHGNRRVKDLFWPYEGRFTDPSSENMKKQAEGTLLISLPEFKFMEKPMKIDQCDHSYGKPLHPITQSRAHFCAYDRFHQENTQVNTEKLRRLDLVPELSKVNSEVCEELFSELDKYKHFLTQMSPIHHIFLLRLLCHFRNEKLNNHRLTTLQKQLKTLSSEYRITTSWDGRVTICTEHLGMLDQVVKCPK